MLCLYCSKETTNPKFCSRSCAARWNNTHYPKRETKKKCLVCGAKTKSYRHNRCEYHWQEYNKERRESYKFKTIGEYRNKLSVIGKHVSWLHSHVRNFARTWNKGLLKLPCAKCNYDKHVELCHIRPVSSFPDDALLVDVNAPSNVVQLCPNCHWELDNGYLVL